MRITYLLISVPLWMLGSVRPGSSSQCFAWWSAMTGVRCMLNLNDVYFKEGVDYQCYWEKSEDKNKRGEIKKERRKRKGKEFYKEEAGEKEKTSVVTKDKKEREREGSWAGRRERKSAEAGASGTHSQSASLAIRARPWLTPLTLVCLPPTSGGFRSHSPPNFRLLLIHLQNERWLSCLSVHGVAGGRN